MVTRSIHNFLNFAVPTNDTAKLIADGKFSPLSAPYNGTVVGVP